MIGRQHQDGGEQKQCLTGQRHHGELGRLRVFELLRRQTQLLLERLAALVWTDQT